jgi:outer membrane protein assembly factor BamD
MRSKLVAGLIVLLVFAAAPACGKKTKVQLKPAASAPAASDEALFNEGGRYLKKDPERARLYMRQIIDTFPQSFFAQRAKLAIADSYFKEGDEGNMILAAAEYTEFIRLHPTSPSASYAQYRIALTYFNKSLKPGRDQQKTQLAIAEFKKLIALYPLAEEVKEARKRILACEERLAAHALLISEHYVRTKTYAAAIDRLTEILTTYPAFTSMDRVYYDLGACYVGWGKPDQAIPYLTKLVTDFPKSKLSAKGQKLLAVARTAKPAPPAPAKKAAPPAAKPPAKK